MTAGTRWAQSVWDSPTPGKMWRQMGTLSVLPEFIRMGAVPPSTP